MSASLNFATKKTAFWLPRIAPSLHPHEVGERSESSGFLCPPTRTSVPLRFSTRLQRDHDLLPAMSRITS